MPILNLLPPEVREAQHYALSNRRLVNFGTSALFAFGVAVTVLLFQTWLLDRSADSSERSLSSTQSELDRYAEVEEAASGDSKKLTRFQTLRSKHPYWDRLISEIAAKTPAGIYLTAITAPATPDEEITLNGLARDVNEVAGFAQALDSSPRLEAPKVQTISPDSDELGFGRYNFSIKATLTPEAFK